MKYFRCLPGLCAVAALLLAVGPARAQDDQVPEATDPPARVARLSFLYGSVSFQPAGENDWVTAVPNRPLTTGDSLWVDAGGRAEMHVGSTAIRVGQSTGVTLLEVSDRVVQLRVAQGTVIVNARHVDDDDFVEVDTPNLAFSVLAPGEYRIDVNPDGTATSAAVWRGQGQVNGGGRTYTVVAGQQAHFEGLDSLTYEIAPVPQPDALDSWAADRDRREDRSSSANYVSREVTGYEDLDSHGQWSVVAAYGPVWTPVGVPVGWAPYRYGHWVWIEPWGWTWVDDQPWGFAPFHYGRWAFVGGAWVWIPGPVVVRPVYAPALVGFVGGGPGVGFGIAIGGGVGVGWFPLGPGEVFVPGYRVSRVYVTNVNITNTRVETARVNYVYNAYTAPGGREVREIAYANRATPGAVTVVTRETFVGARPVGANVVAVNREEIDRAPVTHMAAIAPVRSSVMGAGAPVKAAPPASMELRRVISNRMPAPPPQSFTQRQQQLNAHPGQPAPAPTPAPPPARTAGQAAPAPAAQPSRRYEQVGPPPVEVPAPPRQKTPPPPRQPEPAPQAQTPPPAHPNVQLAPAPQPKSNEELKEEDKKNQKFQQQQQQKSTPPKSNKQPEKPKDKDKPNKP